MEGGELEAEPGAPTWGRGHRTTCGSHMGVVGGLVGMGMGSWSVYLGSGPQESGGEIQDQKR